ncbi:hypothetical protein D6833_05085 [Candidatus Parcubacteria bacterium]|nr:MAG: hypothetical protein D6833_05085 [Candidatus Parcubacteria bacterium]
MDADYFIEAVEKHACAACAQAFRMGMEAAGQRKVRVVVNQTDYGDRIFADDQIEIAMLKSDESVCRDYEEEDMFEIDGEPTVGYINLAHIDPVKVAEVFAILEARQTAEV